MAAAGVVTSLCRKAVVTTTVRLRFDDVRLTFDCHSTLNRSRIAVVTTTSANTNDQYDDSDRNDNSITQLSYTWA